jgi:uncharacterized protein with NRDE domain
MCTLIALHRCVPGVPLIVAANRDEFTERPSEAPALRELGRGFVLAPRDAQAGGTWLGVNPAGVLAAITNRRAESPDPSRRSRGLLVLDALAAESAAEAATAALALPHGAYNPFNLFVADAQRAFAISYGVAPKGIELAAGSHVIGNADLDAPPPAKVARIAGAAAQVVSAAPAEQLERLADLCRSHGGGGAATDDVCVHAGAYGTRSSTLLRLAETASESALLYADGEPCRTAYRDYTPLLHQLARQAGSGEGVPPVRRPS